MPSPCPLCDDAGLRMIERPDGSRAVRECSCRQQRRAERQIAGAHIPERYAHCTLEDYETRFPSAHRSLGTALVQARNFARAYPLETNSLGLLFTGRPGLGKTHLAVGLLNELVTARGARGLFADYRDLLKQVQNSYNPAVAATELDLLRPVFEAEVLVLDDLGASKPTDWVFDTVAHILNNRYNNRLTTIITTNYVFAAETPASEIAKKNEAQRIMTERTLGDRIGDRVLSRLREMCVIVEMTGEDFRNDVRRARFV